MFEDLESAWAHAVCFDDQREVKLLRQCNLAFEYLDLHFVTTGVKSATSDCADLLGFGSFAQGSLDGLVVRLRIGGGDADRANNPRHARTGGASTPAAGHMAYGNRPLAGQVL